MFNNDINEPLRSQLDKIVTSGGYENRADALDALLLAVLGPGVKEVAVPPASSIKVKGGRGGIPIVKIEQPSSADDDQSAQLSIDSSS